MWLNMFQKRGYFFNILNSNQITLLKISILLFLVVWQLVSNLPVAIFHIDFAFIQKDYIVKGVFEKEWDTEIV